MFIHRALKISFLLLACTGLRAQSADEIIKRYEEALGGHARLESLQSVRMEAVTVLQNGNEVNTVMTRVHRELFRNDVNFGMGSFSMVVTPKGAWASNPRSGGKLEALPEPAAKALQNELDLSGPLVNAASKGYTVSLEGKDTINGKEAFKLKLTNAAGEPAFYYLDTHTYFMLREQKKGMGFGRRGNAGQAGSGAANSGDQLQTTDFGDYQKTADGYWFPFTIKRGGMAGSMIVEKIEVNKPVDPKLFKAE